MSCEFCKKFDFTSVAVKENNICTAGGWGRFTDKAYQGRGFQLFNFCPVCGANLCYYTPEKDSTKVDTDTVIVALDEMGNRIDYAVLDGDHTMLESEYQTIRKLATYTGCGYKMCKDAYHYAQSRNGGYDMMLAYCKALTIAVGTPGMSFDERVDRFMKYYDKATDNV